MSGLADIYKHYSSRLECRPTHLSPVLPSTTGIKAVIFDIYGTLFISGSGDIGVSSSQQKETALRDILKHKFKVSVPSELSLTNSLLELIRDEHARAKKTGIDHPEIEIRDLWRTLMAPYGLTSSQHIEELSLNYEAVVNPVWPMPHLQETLSGIIEKGVALGIVSNAQFYTPFLFDAFLNKSLSELNFTPELSIYSYQERQAKPGQALYTQLRTRLLERDITSDQVLYVGNDMRNDIWPAHQLGFKTVLFAGDERSLRLRKEMNLPAPYAVITDLSQLLQIL